MEQRLLSRRAQVPPIWLALLLALVFLPSVAADHVEPEVVPGPDNHTCSDFAPDDAEWRELKVDPPRDGDYTSDGGELTVTVDVDQARKVFDWTASEPVVVAVFVKAGSAGHHLYTYDPPSAGDGGLTTPGEGSRNQISHISFCYIEAAAEEPTCEDQPDMQGCAPPTCEEQPDQEGCAPPTCEDQPDMEGCEPPTCEEQPDMEGCEPPTCEEQPDQDGCEPPTCEEQPDMEGCEPPTCEDQPDQDGCEPPTCEEQPDQDGCEPPTCEEQPDMEGCEPPTCEEQPDQEGCESSTCEDQPDMEGCGPEVVCPTGLTATPSQDGSIRLDFTPAAGSDSSLVYRAEGDDDFAFTAKLDEGVATWTDTASTPGKTYRYTVTALFDGDEAQDCEVAEATAIPDFPTLLAGGGAAGLSLLAYAIARRKK